MINKVILIGRLTKDIDLRYSENENAFARFQIAVDRMGKDDAADFISCVAFGKTAETLEKYVGKGKMIGVVGHIQTGKYTDQNYSDVTHYTTDVMVENVQFLSPKEKTDSQPTQTAPTQPVEYQDNLFTAATKTAKENDEDLPF